MTASPLFDPRPPKRKLLSVSSRQRALLHRLLHRDLAKCSTVALNSFEHRGWISGSAGGYQLTEQGRRVAELSELVPSDRELELDLSGP